MACVLFIGFVQLSLTGALGQGLSKHLKTVGKTNYFSACNPKGWEIKAGGRSLAETSGEGLGGFLASWRDARGLRPLQGRLGIWDRGSGGGAARNHRLLSGKPSACGMADPKTNRVDGRIARLPHHLTCGCALNDPNSPPVNSNGVHDHF